jgi:hypothetical protein
MANHPIGAYKSHALAIPYRNRCGSNQFNECERNYYSLLLDENDYEDCEEEDEEIACVGAGLGGGFQSTT